MKEKLTALWGQVKDNREMLIQVGSVVLSAMVGAIVANAVANSKLDDFVAEEGFALQELLSEDDSLA